MSLQKEQQVVKITYHYTKKYRVPLSIDLNDKTKVKDYGVYCYDNQLEIKFTDGEKVRIDAEINDDTDNEGQWPEEGDGFLRVELEDVECCASCSAVLVEETCPNCGELTPDKCDACGAQRRTNYDWALRNDGEKSFCRPCGKKFDDGELTVFQNIH